MNATPSKSEFVVQYQWHPGKTTSPFRSNAQVFRAWSKNDARRQLHVYMSELKRKNNEDYTIMFVKEVK